MCSKFKIGQDVMFKGDFHTITDIDEGYDCLALDGDRYIAPNHKENNCITAPIDECIPHPEHADGSSLGETNFRPIPVTGGLEKILSYREGGCKSCEWHPDVCKHCLGSLFDNGRLTQPQQAKEREDDCKR